MKSNTIEDFILKSERNLTIAATVGQAWPEIRHKLVLGFLGRLEARLRKNLKGWRFEIYGGPFYVQADSGYYFWKPAWANQYNVGLYWADRGEKMIFGVGREKHKIGRRRQCREVFEAIKTIYPLASQHSWWEARIRMTNPASDWSMPETLWQMHRDSSFLREVEQELLAMARLTEPIIDRWIKKQ